MKKLLLTSIITLVAFASFSQVDKGTKILGGSGALVANLEGGGGSILSLQPRFLYAINNHVALGGTLGLTIAGGSTNLVIGPEARYYFTGKPSIQPFLYGNMGVNTRGGSATFGAGGGGAFLLNKAAALELTGGLLFGSNGGSVFLLQAGFSIYLD